MSTRRLSTYRAAIVRACPHLADARFSILARGWDSVAVEADERLVFKFPQSVAAEAALVREAALLERVRPAVSMPVPEMVIFPGPPLFSRHEKLQGTPLLSADYERLGDEARRRLADDLARFYAELHAISLADMRAAGALPVQPWQSPAAMRERALPLLPKDARQRAARALAAYEALPPDPHGHIYGFFDGHGWNMAFDAARHRLNGLYDFADSGFGPLHQEFIYSNLISADLTARLATAYERRTGRPLDRRRIALLTMIHRLSELAELAHDAEHRPTMLAYAVAWAREAAFRTAF